MDFIQIYPLYAYNRETLLDVVSWIREGISGRFRLLLGNLEFRLK